MVISLAQEEEEEEDPVTTTFLPPKTYTSLLTMWRPDLPDPLSRNGAKLPTPAQPCLYRLPSPCPAHPSLL